MNRLSALAIISLIPAISLADERPYAFTYEPTVPAKGEVELEFYETFYQPRTGGSDSQEWVHQLELGYGITDQFDLAAYGVFRTTPTTDFEPAAVKLRGRYKLLDAGSAPIDLVLYAEVEKEVVDDKPWVLEEKLILGRNYGRFAWALNLIAEQEFPSGGGTEYKYGWSAGAAYEPVQGLRLGAETFGSRAGTLSDTGVWKAYAGPTGSVLLPFLVHGSMNSAWLTLGAGFGLNDDSDKVRARAIIGCDF
jgi:hypothetical protein